MARKLTNNKAKDTSGIITLGLDVGYGYTKATTGDRETIFPSVISKARELKFQADEIAAKYPGDQLTDEYSAWFIGNLANSQGLEGERISLRGRTADEEMLGNPFRIRMMKAALAKLLPDYHNGEAVHIRIATGLPVEHMRDSVGLKKALIGQHPVISDLANFVANVTEVMVMPQPYGTIYSRMLKPNGQLDPCHTAIRTGVVDIGRFSIDVTTDDNGEYIDAESGTVEGGVFLALERIKSAVNGDYRYIPSDSEAEAIMKTGCIRINGQTLNYQDVISEAVQPVKDATLNLMNHVWRNSQRVDVIYLSGGGAMLVSRDVQAAYPQAVLVDDAQTANARGYRSYAMFALAEG